MIDAPRWVRSPLDQRSHALTEHGSAFSSVVALCGHLMPYSVQSSTDMPSLCVCETCDRELGSRLPADAMSEA